MQGCERGTTDTAEKRRAPHILEASTMGHNLSPRRTRESVVDLGLRSGAAQLKPFQPCSVMAESGMILLPALYR